MKVALSLVFFATLFLESFYFAQAPANFAQTSPQAPPPARASLSGTVVRAGTAQPLRNVRVSLRRTNADSQPGLLRGGIDSQLAVMITSATANVATVMTDDMGRFLFTGMAAGNYYVSAERDGYVAWEYGQRSYAGKGVPIPLAAGEQRSNIDLQLLQASVISGRVINPDGEPASQVAVQAFTYRYADGKRAMAQIAAAQTNDLGEYRLFWLQPGEYFLAATSQRTAAIATGQVDVSQAVNDPARNLQVFQAAVEATVGLRGAAPIVEAFAPETATLLYYPGTIDPDAATPVRVAPAAEMRGLDFAMRPIPAVTISGRVAAPFNLVTAPQPGGRGGGGQANTAVAELRGLVQGRAGAQVSLSRVGGTRTALLLAGLGLNSAVRPDGGFEFRNVPPGAYYIYATAVDPNGQRHTGRARVDVINADVTNATVQIRPDIELRGRILLAGQPPQSFRPEALRVQLVPEEISGTAPALINALAGRGLANLPTATPAVAQVAQDGTFVLMGVGSSEYRVQVVGLPNTAYVDAGRLGGTDALSKPVSVQDSREMLELQIAFDLGRVSGNVLDTANKPIAAAIAVLVPDESRRFRSEMYFTGNSDSNGQFSFTAVPAGSYKLFAWEDVPSGAWEYADFIRQYEQRGVHVSVTQGGTSTVDARVIPAGE